MGFELLRVEHSWYYCGEGLKCLVLAVDCASSGWGYSGGGVSSVAWDEDWAAVEVADILCSTNELVT